MKSKSMIITYSNLRHLLKKAGAYSQASTKCKNYLSKYFDETLLDKIKKIEGEYMEFKEQERNSLELVSQILKDSPFNGWVIVAQSPEEQDMISITSGGRGISHGALVNGLYDSANRFAQLNFKSEITKTDFILTMAETMGVSMVNLKSAIEKKLQNI